MTLGALIRLYATWLSKQVTKKFAEQGTFDYYAYYHRQLLAHCGDVDITSLKPVLFIEWKQDWHAIQAVQRLFNWSEDMQINSYNPFRRVKKPPIGERQRIFRRGEDVKLLRAAGSEFRRFGLTLRETIARPAEARELFWDELHVSPSGLEYFMPTKFKGQRRRKDRHAVRIIPITPRMSRLLARLRRARRGLAGPVLLNTEGEPWSGNAVRLQMQGLRKRVGLVEDRRGEQVVAYTFRHTSATRAAQKGIRDRILAELLGHSSTRTTARYQHLDAVELLDLFVESMSRRKSR